MKSRRLAFIQKTLLTFALLLSALPSWGQDSSPTEIEVRKNIPYDESVEDAQARQFLTLDLILPAKSARTGTIFVWFHGGGLNSGDKNECLALARLLAANGIVVALPNYRLHPAVSYPTYLQDAARAVAWAGSHGAELTGEPARLFIGGYSAGGYLSAMLVMDTGYLQRVGVDRSQVAGLIALSGQMSTHFTVRKERGIASNTIVCDQAAPMYYTRKETPPLLFIVGDADWPARLEENQYFAASLRAAGNTSVAIEVIPSRTHESIMKKAVSMADPVPQAILSFIQKNSPNPAAAGNSNN